MAVSCRNLAYFIVLILEILKFSLAQSSQSDFLFSQDSSWIISEFNQWYAHNWRLNKQLLVAALAWWTLEETRREWILIVSRAASSPMAGERNSRLNPNQNLVLSDPPLTPYGHHSKHRHVIFFCWQVRKNQRKTEEKCSQKLHFHRGCFQMGRLW